MALVKRSTLADKGRPSTRRAPEKTGADVVEAPSSAQAPRPRAASRMGGRQTASERIAAATQELAGGIGEAGTAAEQLRRGLEQIAGAAEEAAGAAHESLAAITSLTATFGQARSRAEVSQRRTEGLQSALLETAALIEASVSAVEANAARQLGSVRVIAALEAEALSIGEITHAVADISDRTNLLALNAAIEAARAGDQGRGFAVVADEVRGLAEAAERRAGEVREAAEAIVQEVRVLAERIQFASTRAAEETAAGRVVAATLKEIRSEITVLANGSQEVLIAAVEAEAAAREAQRGAESISSAAEEQSAATAEAQRAVQQQSTAIEESQRTSEALATMAEGLQEGAAGDTVSQQVAAAAEELSSTVQELSGASGEILIAIDQISRGAQIQAAATQQANAAVTQIERAALRTREATQAAFDRARAVEQSLAESRAAVRRMTDGVASAFGDTRATTDLISGLEASTRRIEKLVDNIALVAAQTTMLAVSGSVEAARAGEQGRGFALVSGDIRSLARESGESAERVKDVVRSVQAQISTVRRDLDQIAAVTEGEVQKNRQIDQRLEVIEADVATVRDGAREIAAGAGAILDAARQVLTGTEQIAAAAEQTSGAAGQATVAAREQARGAEDLAAAIEEIAQLADALRVAAA